MILFGLGEYSDTFTAVGEPVWENICCNATHKHLRQIFNINILEASTPVMTKCIHSWYRNGRGDTVYCMGPRSRQTQFSITKRIVPPWQKTADFEKKNFFILGIRVSSLQITPTPKRTFGLFCIKTDVIRRCGLQSNAEDVCLLTAIVWYKASDTNVTSMAILASSFFIPKWTVFQASCIVWAIDVVKPYHALSTAMTIKMSINGPTAYQLWTTNVLTMRLISILY